MGAAGAVAAGYLVYTGIKWLAALVLAPFTGGGSVKLQELHHEQEKFSQGYRVCF